MWWLRRPTRGGVAGPPGGTQRPGFGAVLVVGALAVVAGLFLPVLGVMLIAFLALDVVRQQRRPADVSR
jgi:uncharacterized iron-regulated membrane protein